uniref:COesterase domain-containing protein n=1 Tax=Syphacia muris TaxID=451379 RepID=A0A0N5ALG4_9BILA
MYSFQEPQPPKSWDNTRLCINHGPRGPQKGLFLERFGPYIETNEDCLYLNVFAPQWEFQLNSRPVMVFIHGGGFAVHSSANYGDLNILIVVTIQYRLGLLGFCATGDENCVTNLGLRDQAMALKWVKDNISYFNGDPDNITLFGQSAGAASVDMLCLSPYTRELFNKAVLLGGSASCAWAIADINDVRESAMNIDNGQINESMMNFLKKQPSKRLAMSLTGSKRSEKNPYGMYFVPVIDGDFLPAPIEVLRKNVPKKLCIVGTTEYEGLFFAIKENNPKSRPSLCQSKCTLKIPLSHTLLRHQYVFQLLSDICINNGVHKFAKNMTLAEHTVYLYSFTYSSPQTFGFLSFLFPFTAATHTLELPFLFDKGIISNFKPSDDDRKVINKFTALITNFAIKGDPNGTEDLWKPLTQADTYRYLEINLNCSMNSNYENRRSEFWHKIKMRKNMHTNI